MLDRQVLAKRVQAQLVIRPERGKVTTRAAVITPREKRNLRRDYGARLILSENDL
ncbi:hypothetical protein MMARJ_45740 [Mycobacterium marseillense]|uniref:Uncharacterized protein n=1 Tax=Mycobacterium marseillense TaxID=701042 RepID=A0ABM7JIQ6_9MYCO|nr:hypothetical protein MMARJ_45740 [Mycobacterium marseillense]